MTIEAGGYVSNIAGFVGAVSTSFGTATVTGAGSTWSNSGILRVGRDGQGTLNIEAGGQASNSFGILGDRSIAIGTATETGPGSTWTNESSLNVGSFGQGTLTIEVGGQVSSLNGNIGQFTGSAGTVTVTGNGSIWHNSSTLFIGGRSSSAGGPGSMTVTDQGLVTVDGTLKIWGPGTITLDSGAIVTHTFDHTEGGTFNFLAGSLTINDGLTIGNDPSGVFPNSFTANPERVIATAGTTTISAFRSLSLNGGSLTTHNLLVDGFFNFDRRTLELTGGTITGLTNIDVPTGGELRAAGVYNLPISSSAGSTVTATGSLTLGDATSVHVFYSNGTVNAADHTIALLDANDAVFDSGASVDLGDTGSGEIDAAGGLTLDFGGSITGFGTLNTPDNATAPLINNGNIIGNSLAEPATLNGYVKGVGTCDNCNITDTDSPGLSPATVNRGSVSYNGTLEIEIGGTSVGDFDQLNHILGAGIADLGGTLDVNLINGFEPEAGDMFEIITASSVLDTFDVENLPTLTGLDWSINYSANSVVLEVLASITTDTEPDVDGADFLFLQRNNPALIPQWELDYPGSPLAGSQVVPEPVASITISNCPFAVFLLSANRTGIIGEIKSVQMRSSRLSGGCLMVGRRLRFGFSRRRRSLIRKIGLALVACMFVLTDARTGLAATHTYTSPSSNGNWGVAANWLGGLGPPTSNNNTVIIIQGMDNSPDLQDFFDINLNYTIDSVTLDPSYAGVGNINFSGGSLTFEDNIVNNETVDMSFGNAVRAGSDGAVTVDANTDDINFNGTFEFLASNTTLTATGGESIRFNNGISAAGAISNVEMTINDGTIVHLGASSTAVDVFTINEGTLRLGFNDAVASVVRFSGLPSNVFDLNGFHEELTDISGAGIVDLGSGSLRINNFSSRTLEATIIGTGDFAKEGNGTLTIRSQNTYTGVTEIEGGAVELGPGGNLPSGTQLAVNGFGVFRQDGINQTVGSIEGDGIISLGNARLTISDNGFDRTFDGRILGPGEVQLDGNGTLDLRGSINSFDTLDINDGTVVVSADANLGDAAATIELGSGRLNIAGNITNVRPIVTSSTSAVIDVESTGLLTQSGTISGTGNIEKEGNGSLVFNSVHTYTGDTEVLDGTLRVVVDNAISDSSDLITTTGGTLDLEGFLLTVRSLSGSGGMVDTAFNSGRLTVNAPSGTFAYGGVITGTGEYRKQGGHTQEFSAAQTYTGDTTIIDGILRLTGSGDLSGDTDVTVGVNGTWDLNGLSDTVHSIDGFGSITLGGATLTVTENSAANRLFTGVISGNGNLEKGGTHRLTLTGQNTYAGNTQINNGVLQISSSDNLGAGPIAFFGTSGELNTTLSLTNSRAIQMFTGGTAIVDVNAGRTFTQTGVIEGASNTNFVKRGSGTFVLSSANSGTFSGNIAVTNGVLQLGSGDTLGNGTIVDLGNSGTLVVTQTEGWGGLTGSGDVSLMGSQLMEVGLNNLDATFSGQMSGSGRFQKGGTGVQTLSGSNTYTGATTIAGGTLRLAGNGRLSDFTDVTINSGTILDLNGVSDTIDGLSGAGDVTLGGGTLTVGGNNGSATFMGDITEAGAFVKTGSGTQTLSGTGSWNGGTTVNGGTLRVNNVTTILGTGGITLDGGTLETTALNINSQTITLGPGGGTMDVSSGTSFANVSNARFVGSGSLTKTDGGNIAMLGANTYTGDTIINGGAISYSASGATLSDLTDVVISAGAAFDLSFDFNDDTIKSIAGAGTIRLGGAELTVNQDGGSTHFSGDITETGTLIKQGTHELRLTGDSTHGATEVEAGTLRLDSGGTVANSGGPTFLNGGNAVVDGTDASNNPSTWDMTQALFVATNGTSQFDITGGGQVNSVGGFLTTVSSGDATVNISGTDAMDNPSRWNVTGTLSVGNSGIGQLTVSEGGELLSTTGSLGQQSTGDGTLTVTGTGSRWSNTGNAVVGRGGASDTATVNIETGALVEVGGEMDIFQSGTLNISGGTLIVDTLDSGGGDINFTSGRLQADNVDGNLTNQGGTLAPGSSPGATAFVGSYTQSSGTLEVEVGGLTQGTEYDVLTATGNVNLGGELDVLLIDGFENSITGSDQFTVVEAAALGGAFVNAAPGTRVSLPAAGGHIRVDYGASSPFNTNHVVLSNFTTGDFVATWVDGVSNWTTAANWDINEVPNNSAAFYDVNVPMGTAIVNAPIEVRVLSVPTGGTVQVDNDLTVTEETQILGGALNVATGAVLQLQGNVRLEPGTYSGGGMIIPQGAVVTVDEGIVNMTVDEYRFDDAAETIIDRNTSFVLNVSQISDDAKINGVVTINRGSSLIMAQVDKPSWEATAMSTFNFNNPSPANSSNQIAGEPAIFQGTFNVNGGLLLIRSSSTFRADPNFSGAGVSRATINMNPLGILRLRNLANFEDAVISGGGKIQVVEDVLSLTTFGANADVNVDALEVFDNGNTEIKGGNLRVSAISLDTGSLTLDAAARVEVSDTGTAPGAGFFVGSAGGAGTVTIDGGATLDTVGATIVAGGNVSVIDGTWTSTSVIQVQGGQLGGAGSVMADVVNSDGLISPGLSAGVLSVTGDYTQGTGGTLAIEIGGATLGTEYDQLSIDGGVILEGMLDVSLVDLGGDVFEPVLDDEFTILTTTGGVSGTFATLSGDLPALATGLSWQIDYGANDVVLRVSSAFSGDFDSDGNVDGNDFLEWQRSDGTPSGLADWQNNYGNTPLSGVSASVPEPTAILLLATCVTFVSMRR